MEPLGTWWKLLALGREEFGLEVPTRSATRVRVRIGRFDSKAECSWLDETSIGVWICEDEDEDVVLICTCIYRHKEK